MIRLRPFQGAAALAAVLVCACVCAQTTLTVYTASQPELLLPYRNAFEKAHPDIKLEFLRDSASPIVARILAEKARPKADVVMAVSVIGLENLAAAKAIEPFKPSVASELSEQFLSPEGYWVGMNAWGSAICLNTDLLRRRGLPVPQHWSDLTNPIYRGHIAMPHPLSSSTGYMLILGWMQVFGQDKVWDYIEALNRNILFYTFSGSRPVSMVAQGEVAIGLSSAAFAKPYDNPKIPLEVIEPNEGLGWDAEGAALVAGSRHKAEALQFLDFCAGKEVAAVAAAFSGVTARANFNTPAGNETLKKMLPIDFAAAARDKKAILARWQVVCGEKTSED